jgi:DNA-binding response OmpR family regulator
MDAERTVLLVESDRSALRALRRLMERAGYRVCAATDAEEACRLAEEGECELAVVDLSSPGLAGIALCRSLRDRAPALVLALSAGTDPGERTAALDAGARDYLVKPIPAERLLAVLQAIGDGRGEAGARRQTPDVSGDG